MSDSGQARASSVGRGYYNTLRRSHVSGEIATSSCEKTTLKYGHQPNNDVTQKTHPYHFIGTSCVSVHLKLATVGVTRFRSQPTRSPP